MNQPLSGDMRGLGLFLAVGASVVVGGGYLVAKTAGSKKPLYWALGTPVALTMLLSIRGKMRSREAMEKIRLSYKSPQVRQEQCQRGVKHNFKGWPGNNMEECLAAYKKYAEEGGSFPSGALRAA